MGASALEIFRHAKNVIQRSSYGVNGKKHFDLQKERMVNMASGGNGGTPSQKIMGDISQHEGSIRALHFDDWKDSDFQQVIDIIQAWEETGKLPDEPDDVDAQREEEDNPIEKAVKGAHELLSLLDRDDQVDALNSLAVLLGVMDPDDIAEEE